MSFGALAFVELASIRNSARTIARSPGRLALWAIAGLVFLVLILARTYEMRLHPGAASQVISRPGALLSFGFYLGVIGTNIAVCAAGTLNAFRSNAEARLLSSTGLGARKIAVWLQIRAGTILAARYGAFLFLYFLAFAGHAASGGAMLGGLLATAAAASIIAEVPLPAFLLARRIGQAPIVTFGWFLAALGALYAVAGVAEVAEAPTVARPILHVLGYNPAPFAAWFLSGAPAALAAAFAIPVLLAVAVVPLSKDALPDLYAASVKTLELTERRRRGREEAVAAHIAASRRPPPRLFRGARMLLWSDWTTFRRTRGSLARWFGLVTASAGLGAFVLFAERFGVDRSEAAGLAGALWGIAFVVPVTTSISLAGEIAKPIWWLSQSALRERLAMWSIAHAWRGAVALGIGPALVGIGSADAGLALGSLPVAFVTWWLLIVVGIALYAAFPSKIDLSGPAFIVRFALLGALLVPALATFFVAFFFLKAAGIALLATAGIAIVEALLLLEFATFRIGNNAVGLAMLERSV